MERENENEPAVTDKSERREGSVSERKNESYDVSAAKRKDEINEGLTRRNRLEDKEDKVCVYKKKK